MTERQKKQVKNIKQTLSGQRFYNFYKDGGDWDDYIANRYGDKKEQKKLEKFIDEKIIELFNIK